MRSLVIVSVFFGCFSFMISISSSMLRAETVSEKTYEQVKKDLFTDIVSEKGLSNAEVSERLNTQVYPAKVKVVEAATKDIKEGLFSAGVRQLWTNFKAKISSRSRKGADKKQVQEKPKTDWQSPVKRATVPEQQGKQEEVVVGPGDGPREIEFVSPKKAAKETNKR